MNAKELAERMAHEASTIVPYLLPQGKKSSGEWKVAGTTGEPGTSMSVRLTGAKAGIWSDFATQERGDILDLWAAVRGQSMTEAIHDAKAYLGVRDSQPQRRALR